MIKRNTLSSLATSVVLVLGPTSAAVAGKEVPTLLTIGGITSEVVEWSLGAENNINIGSISGGGGSGKATFKEVEIERVIDAQSPDFLRDLANGIDVSPVTLTRGEVNVVLGEGEENPVLIQDYSIEGSGDKHSPQTETIILQTGSITFEVGEERYCWSRVNNAQC